MATNSHLEARFAAWMDAHAGILGKVARVYARDEGERDDLVRELTYQVWLSASRFAGQARESTWIYRVCLNTALTWRRNAGRRARRFEPEENWDRVTCETSGPAEVVERADLLERTYDALRRLAPLDRSLLLLQLDGQTYREIAEVTGLTENHVGVALTRARQRLMAQMKGIIDEVA